MNCSFCAHAELGAVVAAMTPADAIAAPSSASLRSPIVSSSPIGLAGPCGRPCVETLKHNPTGRNHFIRTFFRRLERSRPKGGAVERPSLDDKRLIVEGRSLHAALRALVETTGRGQCGKGQSRSFSLATDHKRASPLGSTTRKNTIKAPKIIDSKFDTVAVLIFQPNSAPSGGSAWLRKIGSSTMKAAPSTLPRIEPRPPMMTMNMSWKERSIEKAAGSHEPR